MIPHPQALIDPSGPDDPAPADLCGFSRVPSALGLLGNGIGNGITGNGRGSSPPIRTSSMDLNPPPIPPLAQALPPLAPAPAGLLFPGRMSSALFRSGVEDSNGDGRVVGQIRRLQSDPGASTGFNHQSEGRNGDSNGRGPLHWVNGNSYASPTPLTPMSVPVATLVTMPSGAGMGVGLSIRTGESLPVGERFIYFQTKVARLQVWRDDDNALFKQLKQRAVSLMDGIARRCDERYQALCSEAAGPALIHRFPEPVQLFPVAGRHIRRQDSELVRAIRVSAVDQLEATFMAVGRSVGTDEEVFLAQLAQRSALLNDAFQSRVINVVQRHAVDPVLRAAPLRARTFPEYKTSLTMDCTFRGGPSPVEIWSGPIKGLQRMREKLCEYAPPHPAGIWPLSANILDPIRASIVCEGPAEIVQVADWFLNPQGDTSDDPIGSSAATLALPVCRAKNLFSPTAQDVKHGYRDLKLFVLFTDRELPVIGEIQIHDRQLFDYKHRLHRLYTVARASSIDQV